MLIRISKLEVFVSDLEHEHIQNLVSYEVFYGLSGIMRLRVGLTRVEEQHSS